MIRKGCVAGKLLFVFVQLLFDLSSLTGLCLYGDEGVRALAACDVFGKNFFIQRVVETELGPDLFLAQLCVGKYRSPYTPCSASRKGAKLPIPAFSAAEDEEEREDSEPEAPEPGREDSLPVLSVPDAEEASGSAETSGDAIGLFVAETVEEADEPLSRPIQPVRLSVRQTVRKSGMILRVMVVPFF